MTEGLRCRSCGCTTGLESERAGCPGPLATGGVCRCHIPRHLWPPPPFPGGIIGSMSDSMRQVAPYPADLADLVSTLAYKPGWTFALSDIDRGQGSAGLTLDIVTLGYDSYHPELGQHYRVHHYMPVPPASFDRRSWRRWLLEQLLLVERHEACEFFRFELHGDFRRQGDVASDTHVDRPYAPSHGPGNDPYLVREVGTDEDRRTSFRGVVR